MLVADLLRLSAALPPALSGGASPSAPVLFDFRYLRDPEGHERRVEADRHLAALDDAFREVRRHEQITTGIFLAAGLFVGRDLFRASTRLPQHPWADASRTLGGRHWSGSAAGTQVG